MKQKLIVFIQPLFKNKKDYYYNYDQEPLNLEYLSAALESEGYRTSILSNFTTKPKLRSFITKNKPFAIAFCSFTYTLNKCLTLAKETKTLSKNLKLPIYTIFGGYHPSSLPMDVISKKNVDFVIKGEGEKTLSELLNTLKNGDSLKQVSGIYFKINNTIIQNKPRKRIRNLDKLPLPKRDQKILKKTKHLDIIYPPQSKQIGLACTIYSRGCPFQCYYCSSSSIWNRQVFWRSPKKVIEEIKSLISKYGTNLVNFMDLTLNSDKQKVLDLCKEFIKNDLPVYWWAFIRADLLDKELINILAKAKFIKLNIGIESPNIMTARKLKSDYLLTKTKLYKNLLLADKLGIFIKAFCMLGFKEQTKKELQTYANLLLSYPIDGISVAFATPFPGSLFYDECLKNKSFMKKNNWNDYTAEKPFLLKDGVSEKELLKQRNELFLKFYLSPKYFAHIKQKIKNFPHYKSSWIEYLNFLGSTFQARIAQDNIKNLINIIKTF